MVNKKNITFKAVVAMAAATALWGTLIERNLFTLRKEQLAILPSGSRPIKVLHLSDLHLAPWQKKKIKWVKDLALLKPDLLILTGDLLGHNRALDALSLALEPFEGTPGVFVYGSNDFYGPIAKNPLKYLKSPSRLSTRVPDLDTPSLTRMLKKLGFSDLNNAANDLSVNDSKIRFFGLGDPHIRYDDETKMFDELKSLKPNTNLDLKIGLVHAPYTDSLDTLLTQEPDLIFAGHTHGGQVRVPFIGALTSNSDLPPAKARGLSVWHHPNSATFLHVSAGLGTSIYAPVRFACRPEASLLTLSAH